VAPLDVHLVEIVWCGARRCVVAGVRLGLGAIGVEVGDSAVTIVIGVAVCTNGHVQCEAESRIISKREVKSVPTLQRVTYRSSK
jgi:hypothetical protein